MLAGDFKFALGNFYGLTSNVMDKVYSYIDDANDILKNLDSMIFYIEDIDNSKAQELLKYAKKLSKVLEDFVEIGASFPWDKILEE